MDYTELALTALRAGVIYVFLLLVVRLLGKRTVGNFTAFDLIVAFILGEVVDEPIFGDIPLVQGLLTIAVVGLLHYLNSYLSFKSPAFDRLTGGEPTVLVENGERMHDGMARTRVNEETLQSMLRLQQVDQLSDVERATLETNGQLSVIKTEQAQELEKQDLQQALQEAKQPGQKEQK
jgi:uncharacterized membrane protein YcaP (DUF421 family)